MCVNENDLKYTPRDNLTKRQKNLCNEQLALNRDIICCVLASCLSSYTKPVKCLEGVGICGINGMLWEKYFGDDVDVTINGHYEEDFTLITNNVKSNNMKGKILNEDPCVLLRQSCYDFIFLNCKTNATRYFDSLFSNIKDDAVFVIQTSEDPSLYWQTAEIALRNYGGTIPKMSFQREAAIRLVIAEMARASARHNKGFQILCTMSYKPEQSFTIIAKVKKDTIEANKCIANIKKLAYCSLCENWEFMDNLYFIDKSKNELNCDCSKQSEGKVTIGVGPLWAGEIFNVDFVESLMKHSEELPCKARVHLLLVLILEEARCNSKPQEDPPPVKKSKSEEKKLESHPHFYINTHRHSVKELRLQKLSNVIRLLQSSGYRASRTHFDSEAVRTNASAPECIRILRKNPYKALS